MMRRTAQQRWSRCAGWGKSTKSTKGARRFASTVSNEKSLPKQADVVVVGGGSIGASVLYHLQKRGINAVLLERHKLTAGTTWHSAGMLWRLRPSYVDVELHTYTREMCKSLADETDVTSWTENGGLFIATNKERLAEYERLHELGQYYGIESQMLAPSEIQAVHPLINTQDVYGAMYSPTDGTIDPTGVVMAYTKAAKRLGAQVFENTGVASIDTVRETRGARQVTRVKGLVTDCGHRIETGMVVNACGAWANELSAMVGARLPLLAMKHAFVVTEAIPGMHAGLPNVRDHDLSIYLKTQGNAMAIGGYEANPEFWDRCDRDFSFGLFDLDWDTFAQNLNGHIQRCPAIEHAGIQSTVCGPESFTPDHKPLVGPQAGTRGFFNACGFNSMGMMLGGGIGREVATWIDQGSPEVDLFSVDSSRFHPDCVDDFRWVKDRTHESYAKTYSIVFPHDEPLAGRGLRRSAIHDQLAARGCFHQARHGFERPGWFATELGSRAAPLPYDYYGAYAEEGAWRLGLHADGQTAYSERSSIEKLESHPYLGLVEQELTFGWPQNHSVVAEECRAARQGVAIFDQSYFGKFFLFGKDAAKAAQWVCGADLSKKGPGSVTYTPLCNQRGGVEADLTITNMPLGGGHDDPVFYFAAGGNTVTKDFEWIQTALEDQGFEASLYDASDEMCMISVQGPHSRKLLQRLISSGHTLEDHEIPFSTCQRIQVAGKPALCLRLTFVGELGFELHVSSKDAAEVYRALRQAGDAYEAENGVPVRDAGYRAIDSLSAEKGYRHWHADLANCDTPMEAGIGFTVLANLKRAGEPDAPRFLGRQALEAKRKEGLKRKLVCLTLDDPDVALHGMETIWRDGECLGLVRSTAFGHSVGKSIAYGYVQAPKDVAKITNNWLQEATWQVGDKGQRHSATLHLAAPFDPKNKRIKGEYDSTMAEPSVGFGG